MAKLIDVARRSTVVLLSVVAAIFATGPAHACTYPPITPSVDLIYNGATLDGTVSLTVNYSFPGTDDSSQRYMEWFVDGGSMGHIGEGQPSGSVPLTTTMACATAGSHTFTVRARTRCNFTDSSPAEDSETRSYPTQPSVSVSVDNPAINGRATVTVNYQFPNTRDNTGQRELWATVNGQTYTTGSLPISGTWTFTLATDCWTTGSYALTAFARACGRADSIASSSDNVTVNTKPTVSLSYDGPDLNGNGTVTINYAFPNTFHDTHRQMTFYVDGAEHSGGTMGMISGNVGVRSFPLARGCWTTLTANVRSCGRTEPGFNDSKSISPPKPKPTVDVSIFKLGKDPQTGRRIIGAIVTYDVKKPGGTVRVDLMKWVAAGGQVHPAAILRPTFTPNPTSGTDAFTFVAPYNSRQLRVVATVTGCEVVRGDDSVTCDACDTSGNPVFYSDGNMKLDDGDPLPRVGQWSLARSYDSDEGEGGLFGRGWTTMLDRRIMIDPDAVSVTTESNDVVTFREVGGVFRQTWPTSRMSGTLTRDVAAGTYTYRAPESAVVAVFRASDGRLVTMRNLSAAGEAVVAYDGQGRPTTFTDTTTEVTWNFTVDAQRHVTSIAVAGHPNIVWTYAYDGAGNLTSVLAPGNAAWRTYEYAANVMTASRDALGNLIESHTYNADGYAITSTGDVDEIANIEYNLAGAVAEERVTGVTYKNGGQAQYAMRPIGGALRTVRVSGGGCASCGALEATFVRDADGRVLLRQGADGYITRTVYEGDHVLSEERSLKPVGCDPRTDTLQCRLSTDALALAALETTNASTTTTYEHGDAIWPDKVTAVSRPSVISTGDLVRQDRAYHPVTGALATSTVSGWTVIRPPIGDRSTPGTSYDVVSRLTQTTFYDSAGGLAPAFNPGGTFQSAWLSLPQPSGLRKSIDGPREDVEDVASFVYYPIDPAVPALLRGRLAAAKNAAGHITRYEGYDVFGNVTRTVDPNGVALETTYDALGRLLTSTTKGVPGCNTAYDSLCATDLTATRSYLPASGPLHAEHRPGGGVTVYVYDARGRVSTVSRGPAENDLRERIETSYDPLTGKKSLQTTLAFDAGAWVEKTRQSFIYDAHARLQTLTHADNAKIHYTYGPDGHVATVRDENHAAPNTFYQYDPAGRLTSVTQTLAGAPGSVITTLYTYDVHGNLASVTDPNGNATQYGYDDFGQMIQQESPVTGPTSYYYDEAGDLLATADANLALTTRTYDALGRALSAVYHLKGLSDETVTWVYDDTSTFGIGRLSSMSDPSGVTDYAYDRRGLLLGESGTTQGPYPRDHTTQYRYDADGNRTTIIYPSGDVAAYTHDHAGRPRSLSVGGATIVSDASYLPFGPRSALSYGNGMLQTLQYDSRYRVDTNVLSGPLGPLAAYDYGYDAKGNVTSIVDLLDSGYSRSYVYDDLDRLTGANSGSALWGSGGYSYDAMGNLLSATLGSSVTTFAYDDPTPRLLTVTSEAGSSDVTYDAAGNETPEGTLVSPRNHVIWYAGPDHTMNYVYDGRGVRTTRYQRHRRLPGPWATTHTVYTPELQVLSTTSYLATATAGEHPTSLQQIVWFGGTPVAQLDGLTAPRSLLYTFTDHLGTPLLQADSAGQIVWRAEYDPYGTVVQQREGESESQPLRFPGQEVEFGTDLHQNAFRWYRPGWGRYTQADPIGFEGGDRNLYRYALDNPVRFSDPLGLKVRICCRPSLFNFDHCYIEEQRNGQRRTWGLHNVNETGAWLYLTNPNPVSQLRRDDPSDKGGTCETWRQDCSGDLGKCIQKNFEVYPVEGYSEASANLGWPSTGKNSNTFVKCLGMKCGLSAGLPVIANAPGYHRPCPAGF